jgi:hypothetical protein
VGRMAAVDHHDTDDPDACALEALEAARAMPHGLTRAEALKKAGLLRQKAYQRGVVFAKRGRPKKN